MSKEPSVLYPWFAAAWKVWVNLHAQQRLPQTFLISGSAGLGKKVLLNQVEQFLLCLSPSDAGACGQCRSCHLYQQQTHPDYCQLGLDELMSIDDVREINDFFNQTSHQAGRRVITLWQVDKLHVSAANALLKNLEEPPPDVIFLLVAEKMANVLATIQSRAFKMPLLTPSREIALSWLREKYPHKNVIDFEWCLTCSGGAPLKAELLLDDAQLNKDLKLLFEIVFFKQIDLIYQKDLQQKFLNAPQEILSLLYYVMVKLVYYLSSHESEIMLQLFGEEKLKTVQHISIANVLNYIKVVNKTMQDFALPGSNKSLLLEALFFKWFDVIGG